MKTCRIGVIPGDGIGRATTRELGDAIVRALPN